MCAIRITGFNVVLFPSHVYKRLKSENISFFSPECIRGYASEMKLRYPLKEVVSIGAFIAFEIVGNAIALDKFETLSLPKTGRIAGSDLTCNDLNVIVLMMMIINKTIINTARIRVTFFIFQKLWQKCTGPGAQSPVSFLL
jgi:hypothetical protein